jgi:DNA-binding transcriptional LysR family regulator
MSGPDVRGLLAFAKVVESRSFSAAAARLGITKSAVSKLVASTEASLGAQLLVRTTRKLTLTEAGEAVYAACTHLEQDLEAIRQAAALHGSLVGHLRVTAPAVLGRERLVPLAAQFLERHPQVSMDLLLSDDFVDLMEQHVDVALRARRSFSDSSLVVRRIASVRIVVCGSPVYLERCGMPKHPADLARHAR